mgnify:CR=1 FL=1
MTVSKFSKSKAKLEEIKQIGEKRMSKFIDPAKVPKTQAVYGRGNPMYRDGDLWFRPF